MSTMKLVYRSTRHVNNVQAGTRQVVVTMATEATGMFGTDDEPNYSLSILGDLATEERLKNKPLWITVSESDPSKDVAEAPKVKAKVQTKATAVPPLPGSTASPAKPPADPATSIEVSDTPPPDTPPPAQSEGKVVIGKVKPQ